MGENEACHLAHALGCADSDAVVEAVFGPKSSAKKFGFIAYPQIDAKGNLLVKNGEPQCYFEYDVCQPDSVPTLDPTQSIDTNVFEKKCVPIVTWSKENTDLKDCQYRVNSLLTLPEGIPLECGGTAPITGEAYLTIPTPFCIPGKKLMPYLPQIIPQSLMDLNLPCFSPKLINQIKAVGLAQKVPSQLCCAVYAPSGECDFGHPPDPLPICLDGRCCIPGVDCEAPPPRGCTPDHPYYWNNCEEPEPGEECNPALEPEKCCIPTSPDYPECLPVEIPNAFDCADDLSEVQALFPEAQINGGVGEWSIYFCAETKPVDVFDQKYVAHLDCFEYPPGSGTIIEGTDLIQCKEGQFCQNGLCQGIDEPDPVPEVPSYCFSLNPLQAGLEPTLTEPGYAEKGVGATSTDLKVSRCKGLKPIDYPVCDAANSIFFQPEKCATGFICVDPNGPTDAVGARCESIHQCDETGPVVTVTTSEDSEIDLVDQCTGSKVPGVQGTTKMIDWQCTDDEVEPINYEPNQGEISCPAGTACCVHATQGLGCHADCPKDPPPPPKIGMTYICVETDPFQHPVTQGTLTISGNSVLPTNPPAAESYIKPDKCHGLYSIEQFYCKSSSATGQLGYGKELLLGTTGVKTCTAELEKVGLLAANEYGVCQTDPASGIGYCKTVPKADPKEPDEPFIPDEPKSIACADDDADQDPYTLGFVTLPTQGGISKEDWCQGDYYLFQYECGVDATGEPVWVEVPKFSCPDGCAGGKCCQDGTFEFEISADGIKGKFCLEDFGG